MATPDDFISSPNDSHSPVSSPTVYSPMHDENNNVEAKTALKQEPVDQNDNKRKREPESKIKKESKKRLVWTPSLHKLFVDAVNKLEEEGAVPKKILKEMNVEGITRENVASHLQKYRLHQKKSRPDDKPEIVPQKMVNEKILKKEISRSPPIQAASSQPVTFTPQVVKFDNLFIAAPSMPRFSPLMFFPHTPNPVEVSPVVPHPVYPVVKDPPVSCSRCSHPYPGGHQATSIFNDVPLYDFDILKEDIPQYHFEDFFV